MAGRALSGVVAAYRDAFGGLPRLTWLLCAAAFINRSGAMVVPFLGLYAAERFGLDAQHAGLLIGTYGVGAFVGSWLGGFLTDRLGPVRTQVVTLAASGLWMQGMIAIADIALLFPAVFVLGVLNDAFRPGSITAVAISCPQELRRRALALNRLALNLGWSFGPTIGGYLVAKKFELMFVADGGTCIAAALFLAFTFRRWVPPPPPPRQRGDSLLPFRDRRFLWLMGSNLLVLLAFMQYFTTGSRVFQDAGWHTNQIGWFLAINPIMITLFEMIVVQSLRAQRALPIITIGSAVIGLGHLCFLLPIGAMSIVFAMVVVACGELLQMPMLGAHVNDHAVPQVRGAYNGALGMTFCLALVLAPVLGGTVYDEAGAAALWCTCAGLGVLGSFGFAAAARRERLS